VTLTQRTVYILPTGPGFMLAATLLVLLVASINYQLNLGYVLTFLLAGCAVVGMHVCHGTLRGITMTLIAPDAHFAGANVPIGIQLSNPRRSIRRGIGWPYWAPTTGAGPMSPPRAVPGCRWPSNPAAGPAPPAHLDRGNAFSTGHL
jgi:hypothetical protein